MTSSNKRPGEDVNHYLQPTANKPRLAPSSDLLLLPSDSPSTKKKQSISSRTGQACDRCKVRKIRCDARPGGCSPCVQNNAECKTTDRITGRATSRGHTENLENENTALRLYMVELQAQLKEHGIDPRQAPVSTASQAHLPMRPPSSRQRTATQAMSDEPHDPAHHQMVPSAGWGSTAAQTLPQYRQGSMGDNYLGVASENNMLSPIEGTSLSLFGTKINLADFMLPEPSIDAHAMSYQTFLAYAFGNRPPPQPPKLPEVESCKVFADWYFRSVTPMIPILHRPDFMALLARIYRESYRPTPAETAMVHMMLCIMNFQWSARNKSEQARARSFQHYHYALSFIPKLLEGHQLPDMQALALICLQLRCHPRTGAAWWFTDVVMGLAIESGLHRSAKAWQHTDFDPHTIELRKRVFWCLIALQVGMGGKLGRPMRVRNEDVDIEVPDPEPDVLADESVEEWKKCSFRSGVEGFKLMRTQLSVFATIYSVKSSSGPYEAQVGHLERELDAFKAQLPPELSCGPDTRDDERINALYIQFNLAECQLLLHHPATFRSSSAELMNKNLDICLEAASTLLTTAVQLKQRKSLDTTWYYTMTWLAAISTTLFTYHERRTQTTFSELQSLRKDMEQWVDVMGEVGSIIGTGERLQTAVRSIINACLEVVTAHVAVNTASAAVASTSASTPDPPSQTYNESVTSQTSLPDGDMHSSANILPQGQYHIDGLAPQPNSSQPRHPVSSHFGYGGSQTTPAPAYGQVSYGDVGYNTDEPKPDLHAPHDMSSNLPVGVSNYMSSFSPTVQHDTAFLPQNTPGDMHNSAYHQMTGGPAAWRQFTDNMMTNMTGNTDPMNTPHAYLQFANGTRPGDISGMDLAAALPIQLAASQESQQTWPLIQYHTGQPNSQ